MPVFKPIEAWTWAKKVVGRLINFNTRLVRLDIKADKAPRTTPPKEIRQSDLVKLLFFWIC